MRETRWMSIVIAIGVVSCLITGCDTLRFAPSEAQKQNAYLHQRTVQSAATQAQLNSDSEVVQKLTDEAVRQSDTIMAYYGLPHQLPPTQSIEAILSPANQALTQAAHADAIQRPDPWDVADHLLELGIAIAGIAGGVYGAKAVRTLQLARQKSIALREVVQGNQLFKKQHSESSETFKDAHQAQSVSTRSLVAALK